MKKFESPEMSVMKFNPEDLMRTSACMNEARNCLKCYCSAVTCDDGYTCDFECTPMYDLL